MPGRLCCYKQQQHSKLLAQFVYKVSVPYTKTRAPLPDCRINNALIQFVPSYQDTRTQFVDVLDPPFSDVACSIISCLFEEIFMLKNRTVTKFWHLALGGPVTVHHRVHVNLLLTARCHRTFPSRITYAYCTYVMGKNNVRVYGTRTVKNAITFCRINHMHFMTATM